MDQHFKIRKLRKVENYDGVGMIKNTIQTVRPMSYFGFWNPGNFCLWNPGLWNPSHGIWTPKSTAKKSRIQNVESRIQDS